MSKVNLTTMKVGAKGTIAQVNGGHGLKMRLSALGIRPGVKVTKRSSQLMRGPVTIGLGNTQVAIGFGMAKKIIVELEE